MLLQRISFKKETYFGASLIILKVVLTIEILSINGKQIEALVTGFHTNACFEVSKVDGIDDTLVFEYYDEAVEHKLKMISLLK